MSNCNQTGNQSILEHGLSVRNYSIDLINILHGNVPKYTWKLPDWLIENKNIILNKLLDTSIIEQYTIFHDCGKPYCLSKDEEGQHFINHAEVSYNKWISIFPEDNQVGLLIKMDMDIHKIKAEDVSSFALRKEAATLLVVGLAELHSNAEMFGGIESNSFKIKFKQLDRRGKAICKSW